MGISGLEIRFHGPVPLAAVLACMSAYLMILYWRFLREINFPGAAVPLVLRAAALASTIAMVSGPVVYYMKKEPVSRSVAVLVDVSQSMSVSDGNGEKRFERALEDMADLSGGIPVTAGTFTFSEEVVEAVGAGEISERGSTGGETLIRSALRSISARSGRPPTDVVLLTDGVDTSGLEAGTVGAARVHSIVYGGESGEINTGVYDVRAPEYGFVDQDYGISGEFYCSGCPEGAPVGIELFEDGIRVARTSAEIPVGNEKMHYFSMSYTPKGPGVKSMELLVKTPDEGQVAEDNVFRFFNDVIGERHRVLLVDSPSWDFKFLKNYLEGRKKPALDVVLLGPESDLSSSDARKYLSNVKSLDRYRLVIAGGGAGFLNLAEKKVLSSYLKSGGRVVVLGGSNSLLREGGAWGAILGSNGGDPAGDEDGFEVDLTEEGMNDSLLRIEPGRKAGAEAWKTLPFVETFHKTAAGGKSLAVHPWMKCGGRPCPVIYRRDVSGGRLIVFAFQGLWRWKFVEKKPEYYDILWSNIIDEFMEAEKSRPVRITLSEDTIILSGKSLVSLKIAGGVLGTGERPEIEISVQGEDTPMVIEPAGGESEEDGYGNYYYEFVPGKIGIYKLTARAGGQETEPERLAVNVSPVEYVRIAPDREALEKLASETGGKTVSSDGAQKILDELNKSVSYERVRRRSTPWASAYFMIFIIAALTGEWILRRRGGLT